MTSTAGSPTAALFVQSLIDNGGETGGLIAAYDWSKTSIGPIETWPQSLRTALGLLLRSPLPIVMPWGEDGIMLYNDAYSVFAGGRHPQLLGSKVREGWPEVAAFNDHMMKVVMAGGTLAYKDQELILHRFGKPERVWMNLDYSPVPDETGKPAGVIAIVIETTQRVLAERRADEERRRQEEMLQQMPGFAAIMAGPEHRFTYVNDAYKAMVSRTDLVGKTARDAFPELEGQGFFELLDSVYARGEPFVARGMPINFEHSLHEEYLDFVYQPVRDETGAVSGIFAGGYDVTETRLASERIGLALDSGTVIGTWVWEIPSDTFTSDDRFARTFSLDPQAMRRGVRLEEVVQSIHPDDAQRVADLVAKALAGGGAYSAEYRVRSGGEWRWIEASGRVTLDAEGKAIRFPGVLIDIDDRKTAEIRFAEAANQLELAQRAGGVGNFSIATGSTQLMASAEFCRIFGFDATPVIAAADVEALFLPDDRTLTSTPEGRASGQSPVDVVYRIRRKTDGAVRYISRRAQYIYGADARPSAMIGIVQDVTEREERANALKASEAALRDLNAELERKVIQRTQARGITWQVSPDLLGALNTQGYFETSNPAWKTVLGWTEEEVAGMSIFELLHPDDVERTRVGFELTHVGQPAIHFPNRYRHKNGSYRWISWTGVFEDGYTYCSGRDITEVKVQEEQLHATEDALRQAQKMEAVGQLTGGIAHDFNNMLAVVMGSIELVNRRIGGDDPRTKRQLDAAADAAKRAANLTQRLLAFSRQSPLQPESFNPNRLVAGMSDLLGHSLGAGIRLETVLAAGIWHVHADPNQLENAILNLGVNARDAMPDGGRLTIETQNASLDARYVAAELGLAPGQYVLIAVTDTGSGMPADVIAKAFDPFFTTKAVGKGTGLGLSQVYGFVRQSGGHVKIYSEAGQGTTIKIYLPRSKTGESEPEGAGAELNLLKGNAMELILVVDDEAAVRQFSVEAFTELGYRVMEADGAGKALRLIRDNPDISLLFTDIVMPDANGRKLADQARELRPDLKVLYTTGYTRNAVVHNGVVDQGVELIGKPFTIDDLAARVRAMLDAS